MEERNSILAQMFCLRNGVRTRREKKEVKEFSTVLCVAAWRGSLNLFRRKPKIQRITGSRLRVIVN